MKQLVLVWTADCKESNKQAMGKILSLSQDSELGTDLKYLSPVPEAVHLGKCFKSAFANWFLYFRGQRFNLSSLHVLYNDAHETINCEMHHTTTLGAICNCDRMSVKDLLVIAKPSVRAILNKIPRIVQTIVPEMFCLYKRNSKGVLENPTGVCVTDHGNFLITNNKRCSLFLARLHYLVDVTEVSKSLKNPNGVTYSGGVVYVADTGNGRIAY